MKMYIAGQWTESPIMASLVAPYSGEVVEPVPVATDKQIEQALVAAEEAAVAMGRLAPFERSQRRGEYLPIEAHAGTKGKMGFTMRVPCGVVVAISPFNYPLLLVVH